jgi:uncharacterized protein YjlB
MKKPDPMAFRFEGDDETPNNSALPVLLYRDVVPAGDRYDAATWFEGLFARHGWADGWRNGIHPFLHFHTRTHEVLGIASGRATVQLGGAAGRALDVGAGDVVVLPAGTGHQRLDASTDLLVIGAYPNNGRFDQKRPGEMGREAARRAVAAVPLPEMDPVAGADGPLTRLWLRA